MRAPWSSGSRNRLRDGVGEYVEVMKLLLAGVASEQTQCLHSAVGRPDRHCVKMPGRQPGVDLRLGEDMQTGELLRRQAQEPKLFSMPGGGKRLAANSTASDAWTRPSGGATRFTS